MASRTPRALGVDGFWNVTPAIELDASASRSFSPDIANKDMAGDFGFTISGGDDVENVQTI